MSQCDALEPLHHHVGLIAAVLGKNFHDAGVVQGFANFLNLRADALLADDYFKSDLAWLDLQDPKFDIKKVPEAELCDELKKMTPEKREKHVKEMLDKRNDLQKKIEDLSAKRQTYINEERKKNPGKADKLFDDAVKGALREQAKEKGIEIPK